MKPIVRRQNTNKQLLTLFWGIVFAASLATVSFSQVAAQATSQKTFDTPAKAAESMYRAAKAGDTNELLMIFGPQSKELLSSGDPVADKNDRDQIVKKYEEMNRLVVEPDKSVTLYIGSENWPFPVPLVKKKGAWTFDTQ